MVVGEGARGGGAGGGEKGQGIRGGGAHGDRGVPLKADYRAGTTEALYG